MSGPVGQPPAQPPHPPPYPAYPPPYSPYPPPYPAYPGHSAGPRNGLGVAALVVAVVGLVASVTVLGGLVLGVVAVVLGIFGRRRATRGQADNGGVAIAGIALGALAIVIALVFIPIWSGFFTEIGASEYMNCISAAGSDPAAQNACTQKLSDRLEDQLGITATPAG